MSDALTSKQRRAERIAVLLKSTIPVYALAMIISLAVGAILIAMAGADIAESYSALVRGSIFDWEANSFVRAIKPITETLLASTPLIIAGLGLGFGFRAGLFNIGGKGQIIFGGLAAVWIGFNYNMPYPIHLLVCLVAAVVAGGLYGFLAGYLKAATGANEVIVTIMLNSIASILLVQLLRYKSWQVPGTNEQQTPNIMDSAKLPRFTEDFRLTIGFIIAILACVAVWWYLERSTWGFELRAVGANPAAARTAGMSIGKVTALTMALSGALCGLAGGVMVTGESMRVGGSFGGSVGIDAITVALLGRNKPGGIFAAGLLFGAFKVGGLKMQTRGVPSDMVLILEAVIVLLIMAPEFIRWAFKIPSPEKVSARSFITLDKKEVAA